MRLAHASLALAFAVVCSLPAAAQSFNIDCGASGPPSAAHAAGGIAGPWNLLSGTSLGSLVDTDGNVTGVSISVSPVNNFNFNHPGTTGDDELLMDDAKDLGLAPGPFETVTVSGLANGKYLVRTYAWAPDDDTYITSVSVIGGTGAKNVGGAWPGGHVLGTTYAQDAVASAGTITITLRSISGSGTWNGLQIQRALPHAGQAINIDCGASGPPAAAHAAAGTAGHWNRLSGNSMVLFDVNGDVTDVTVTLPILPNSSYDNPGTSGDDELLMDDWKDMFPTNTATISGLASGTYLVRTYAWNAQNHFALTEVSVLGGTGGKQLVGGAWPGGHVLGTTYAEHTDSTAGTIVISVGFWNGSPAWNGLQIERICNPSGVTSYCTAKVNSCGSLPTIGSSGTPSATSRSGFLVTCSNARGSAPNNMKNGVLVYSVTGPNNSPFQGGFLCVAPQVKRTITMPPAVPGTVGLCDAMHQIDFNAFTQNLIPGQATPDAALTKPCQQVWGQWYARDLLANGPLLSGGLSWVQQF